MRGTIIRKRDEGYGFIKPDEGDKDVFFHASAVAEGTFDDFNEGDVVTFDVEEGPKGPAAANVMKVGEAAAEAPAEEAAPAAEETKEEAPAEEAAAEESNDSDVDESVEVPEEFKALVEQVEKMSVLELHELVKVLEKRFGVSAAAVAVAGGGGGDAVSLSHR